MSNWLEKIIDLAAITNSARLFEQELGQIIARAGFDWFVYLHVRPCGSRFVSNAPKSWQKTYRDGGLLVCDPLVLMARSSTRPFSWTMKQLRHNARREALPAVQAARECGFASGLTIPVGTAFGQVALLTAISRHPVSGPTCTVDEVLAATAVAQLHAFYQRAHHAGAAIARPVTLTPKQALCLKWSAEGKSMRAIAALEAMSYSAVAFHLLNARQALDALSLPQATAIATELRLI